MVATVMSEKQQKTPETLGTRIRRLRREREISQEELANAAGVTLGAVFQLESGKVADAKLSTLQGLAVALGIDVADLTSGLAKVEQRPKKPPKDKG